MIDRVIERSAAFTLLGALGLACSSHSAYIPEQSVKGTLDGRTAASYPLPAASNSQGDLRIASYGISELDRKGDDDAKAVHLRYAVSNHGNRPITLDLREQRIQLPDGRQITAAYASSSGQAMEPTVGVHPGTSRSVDLYFPLPPDLFDAKEPPSFDVVWRMHVDAQTISQITPFDKVTVDPAVARQRAAEEVMLSPNGYWYDPVWGPAVIGAPAWYW
jgi:hypothetical protein